MCDAGFKVDGCQVVTQIFKVRKDVCAKDVDLKLYMEGMGLICNVGFSFLRMIVCMYLTYRNTCCVT